MGEPRPTQLRTVLCLTMSRSLPHRTVTWVRTTLWHHVLLEENQMTSTLMVLTLTKSSGIKITSSICPQAFQVSALPLQDSSCCYGRRYVWRSFGFPVMITHISARLEFWGEKCSARYLTALSLSLPGETSRP